MTRTFRSLTGWCLTPTLLRPFARHLVGKMAHIFLICSSPGSTAQLRLLFSHSYNNNFLTCTFHGALRYSKPVQRTASFPTRVAKKLDGISTVVPFSLMASQPTPPNVPSLEIRPY